MALLRSLGQEGQEMQEGREGREGQGRQEAQIDRMRYTLAFVMGQLVYPLV